MKIPGALFCFPCLLAANLLPGGRSVEPRNDANALPLKAALLQRLCDRMAWTVDPLPLRQSGW